MAHRAVPACPPVSPVSTDHFLPHSWLAPMYMDIACVLASERPRVETIEMAANSVKESLSLPHLPDELHPLNYLNFFKGSIGRPKLAPGYADISRLAAVLV